MINALRQLTEGICCSLMCNIANLSTAHVATKSEYDFLRSRPKSNWGGITIFEDIHCI